MTFRSHFSTFPFHLLIFITCPDIVVGPFHTYAYVCWSQKSPLLQVDFTCSLLLSSLHLMSEDCCWSRLEKSEGRSSTSLVLTLTAQLEDKKDEFQKPQENWHFSAKDTRPKRWRLDSICGKRRRGTFSVFNTFIVKEFPVNLESLYINLQHYISMNVLISWS